MNNTDLKQFRADNGRFLTEALFWETSRNRDAYAPVFTLKPHEHEGCASMKALYLAERDPTEYQFAMKVLGSWQHWTLLCSLSWFQPHLEEWRSELDVLLRAEAASAARSILSDESASPAAKMQAAKFIANRDYRGREAKGRPKKADIAREARKMAEHSTHTDEDYMRVMN